jgi:Flp pilus assembly protein TadD
VAPAGQNVSHGFPASTGLGEPATLAAVAGVLALLAAALLAWRHAERAGPGRALPARVAAFGVLWWFLLLSPTSSVVPIADLVAEHRVYLALLGPALALAVAADAALAARAARPRWGVAAAAAVLLLLGGATAARAAVWRSAVSLWADAAAGNPSDPRVAGNHAYALAEAGRIEEARAEFKRAMRLPSTPRQLADNVRNYSAMEAGRGDNLTALSIVDLGIAVAPFDHELRVNRAIILHDLYRPAEGLEDALLAVRIAPGEPGPHHALGVNQLDAGQPGPALQSARTALRIDPTHQAARRLEFLALARLGERAAGCAAWRRLQADGLAMRAMAPHAAALGCP